MKLLPAERARVALGLTDSGLAGAVRTGRITTHPDPKHGRRLLYDVDSFRRTRLRRKSVRVDAKRRPVANENAARFCVTLSDIHFPEHDVALWAKIVKFLHDTSPDVIVLNGDIGDFGSVSSHGGVAVPATLLADVDAVRQGVAQIIEAAPDASIHYLEGNHETRLTRAIIERLPTLHGAVSLPEMLQLAAVGVRWHPYGEVLRIGRLAWVHGRWTTKHHAAKHLDAYQCSIVYGHTHRPQTFSQGHGSSVRTAYGLGALCRLDQSYLGGMPSGWAQGFAVHWLHADGRHTTLPIAVDDGCFAWAGTAY